MSGFQTSVSLHMMSRGWTRCQRMIQYEQHRFEELRKLASQAPQVNAQPAHLGLLHVQIGATNPNPASSFRAIEQVLRELSALQKKYMLHLNPSELDSFVRVLLKVRFKTRGKAKLLALVEELRHYNDSIERRLAIPVRHPPQGPMPSFPPPVPGMLF